MKMHTIKTTIKNRLMIIIPGALTVLYFVFRIGLEVDPELKLYREIGPTINIIGAVIFGLLPIFITIFSVRMIVKIHKSQSEIDYLTYVDQNMLNDFQWDEDPEQHMMGQIYRNTSRSEETEPVSGLISTAQGIAPKYSLEEINDIPDYDPTGPSPFKKV